MKGDIEDRMVVDMFIALEGWGGLDGGRLFQMERKVLIWRGGNFQTFLSKAYRIWSILI